MAENIQAGIDALVMDERDHVATALRELSKGTDITCRLKEDLFRVKLLDNIEFGHKLAIRDIAKGTLIRKYGEVIGKATQDIATGQHVHVHNVEGVRGRGDQASPAAQS